MADGERRLSAVMLTDLVGYTALTQRDEAGALRSLEEHRGLVRPLLKDHAGREVKTIGDAFLVEFGNALDATRCAIAIQKASHERNRRAPASKIELRIGLHVGDVVHQAGDIYGDAVNLVSRVEPLAEPGGICLSGPVFDQVRNKIDLPFEPLGETHLKNVEFPVPLYRLELPWLATSLARKTPWVARPTEQEALRGAVDRAAKGEGSAVVLQGESGVGKTRLAEETIRLAERAGFRALRGRAFSGERALPYSHWVEMIQAFLRDAPAPLVQRVGWQVAGEVSKIVPELADKVGPIPSSPPGDPEAARARFYEGVTQFMANLSNEAPLLLLFDDLQWADQASLSLLEFALRSVHARRILVLATSHELDGAGDSPLPSTLRYLEKNGLLSVVSIRRMDPASVGTMIQRTFGEAEPVSEEFVRLVHERTGGNPFFVEEVLRSLVEEGAIYRTDTGSWERKEIAAIVIPKTVRDVVKQRFNRLDDATQATLRIASVLGVEFSVDLLRDVSGTEEEKLLEQLERMVRAGMLEETKSPTRLQSLSFADPQLRRVLYDETLSMRRIRYHRKAAEALERIAGTRKEEFASDLAYHFREGQEATKARDYALMAAQRWAKLFGFEEAERQYLSALALLEEAPDDRERGVALEGLGRAHSALGQQGRAVVDWEAAVRAHEAAGEKLRAGRLCVELADMIRLGPDLAPGGARRVVELLEQGRALLEPLPPSVALALLYDLWGVTVHESGRGSLAEGRQLIERGAETARAAGDVDAEKTIAADLSFVTPLSEKDKHFEYLEAGEAHFSRPGRENWEQLISLRGNLSFSCLGIRADPVAALAWATKAIDAATRSRNRAWEAEALKRRVFRALLWVGRLREGEEALRRAEELTSPSRTTKDWSVESNYADLALVRGDLAEAARRLAGIPDTPGAGAFYANMGPTRAELSWQTGDHLQAAERMRGLVGTKRLVISEVPADTAPRLLRWRVLLLEILLALPGGSPNSPEVARLREEIALLAEGLGNPFAQALRARTDGLVARCEGRRDDAIEHLARSVEGLRRCRNAVELVRSLQLLSEMEREANRESEAARHGEEAARLREQLRGAGLPSEQEALASDSAGRRPADRATP